MNILTPMANHCAPLQKANCPAHGPFSQRAFAGLAPACPLCAAQARARAEATRLLQHQQEAQTRAWRAAGISPRFMGKDFSNYQASQPAQRAALNAVQGYCQNFAQHLKSGRCLALLGRPGTGKTHLAASLVKSLLAQNYQARLISAYDCLESIKATWNREPGAASERQVMAELARPHLLALDEVGAQFASEASTLLLFRVLDARYQQMRPSVIVSNEDVNGLKKYLGERAFDRLKENQGQLIGFNWPSQRARPAPVNEVDSAPHGHNNQPHKPRS